MGYMKLKYLVKVPGLPPLPIPVVSPGNMSGQIARVASEMVTGNVVVNPVELEVVNVVSSGRVMVGRVIPVSIPINTFLLLKMLHTPPEKVEHRLRL